MKEQFHDYAKECRQQAEKALSAVHKERWLTLAAQWELMAKEADRSAITSARVVPGR